MDHTPMQLDMNISVGNILTAVTILAAIFGYLVRKDKKLAIAEQVISMQFKALHDRMEKMEKIHIDIAQDLKKLGDVFVVMAKYDQKFLYIEERMGRAERQIDEFRHGKGLIE